MKGYFDDKTLEIYASMVMDREGVDFSEGEDTYDFTRCMRSDGSYYGTSGRCRQGSPAGPKEEAEKTGRQRTPAGRSARSKDDDVSFPSNNKKPGLRDSTVAESRKAMRHHREQMNIHGNKIAELKDAGKRVPKSLQAKYDLAKASYNSHRKAINDATGVEKRPVMQEARERGRAAEKENQAKRSLQRGEESVAKAAARAKAKFNKEEMESPKNKADMDIEGLRKLVANSPTAQRQLREAAEAKAKAGK